MTIPTPDQVEFGRTEANLRKFLQRHKVGLREYELCPKISDIIHECIGGRYRALETLKFSSNPSARQLLEFSQKLPLNMMTEIPIEAICLAAKVEVATIAGALVMATRDVARMKSALITMREHPDVVQATADVAKTRDTYAAKDREMFHKAVGWLPTPKGSSVNVNVFDPHKGTDDEDDSADGVPSLEAVFDSDPKEIEAFGDRRRALLESGK